MDATATTLPLPHQRLWTAPVLALLAALLIAMFATGILVGRTIAPPVPVPAVRAQAASTASFPFQIPKVTGTGPDLVVIARWSEAVRHAAVTGTGPGLTQVGAFGQAERG